MLKESENLMRNILLEQNDKANMYISSKILIALSG